MMAAAAALALDAPAGTLAETRPLVTFGLISDTHVCDKPDQAEGVTATATARYYSGGLAKLEAFARAMSDARVAFIAELGDLVDNPADARLPRAQKQAAAIGYVAAAEARLALFPGPRHHVFGNHDTDRLSKEGFVAQVATGGLTPPAGPYYYSWTVGGVHFVVLDAGYKSDGSDYSGEPGAPGAGYPWDDANLPPAERAWLKADLAQHPLPTIVFTHQLLNPLAMVAPGFDPRHQLRQAAAVRQLLEQSGQVLAVFSGHYHDGGYQQLNGIHYIILQANAAYGNDAAGHNQYAVVAVEPREGGGYRLNVLGHGLQKSYSLAAGVR